MHLYQCCLVAGRLVECYLAYLDRYLVVWLLQVAKCRMLVLLECQTPLLLPLSHCLGEKVLRSDAFGSCSRRLSRVGLWMKPVLLGFLH